MRAPRFWWKNPGLAASLLRPAAALYGAVAARRLARPGKRIGIPVVCVGDLTVGGAGKTPAALAVARLLATAGERPFFLSRGYGGRLAGPVRVDGGSHTAADVGDEPLLLARAFPTIVARDRVAGARAARAAGAGAIVMDDGFQNPSLEKDAAVLVVDARRGIGNGAVFPAGPLRAPLMAQLARAHALLVVGEGTGAAAVIAAARASIPRFHGRLEPDAAAVAALTGRPLLAFAAIGDPDKFFRTLADAGLDVPVRRGFPDHHAYTEREAAQLLAEADAQGLTLVTTEKDSVRLGAGGERGRLQARARVLPVTLALEDGASLRPLLLGRIDAG